MQSPPLITFSSDGHTVPKCTIQPVVVQLPEPFPTWGSTIIGRLYPLIKLIRKKSNPLDLAFRLNSATVAGEEAFPPLQSMVEESQSPVRQESFPLESLEQWVLPHKRPDQERGMVRTVDSPEWREKPVVEGNEVPAPWKMPGKTVRLQLLMIVSVVEWEPTN
jgi:hypothetical protein